MFFDDALTAIYGKGAAAQIPRYTAVAKQFLALFGAGEVIFFRAPGRVNLIGGHTDYNLGYALPVALDKDIVMAVRPRNDGCIRLHNCEPQFQPFSIDINEEILPATSGDWSNYVRGVAQLMSQQQQRPLHGFDGLVAGAAPTGIPRGAGLSSSSALTVATAVALAHINQWQPRPAIMVQFCGEAEWFVGTRGGMMDHSISIMGQKEHALFLDCRPDQYGHYQTLMVPLPTNYAILIVNSGIKHQNVGGQFNRRVAACRIGAALLDRHFTGIESLRDVTDIPWSVLEPILPDKMTVAEAREQGLNLDDFQSIPPHTALKIKARCYHIWSENQRVHMAVAAIHLGDMDRFGQLLNEANQSLLKNYEVSCPEIEQLTAIIQAQAGVAGLRLTGAGWGGCLVVMVEETAVATVSQQTQKQYLAATGIQAEQFVCQPGPGASLVNRVIV